MVVHYFMVEEARELLAEVKPILIALCEIKRRLETAGAVSISFDDEAEHAHFDTLFHKEFHRLSYELYSRIEMLEQKGIVVRDPSIGLIDFLSLHEGREICLCFRLGEKRIAHWHECNAGYAGRKPLRELIL